MDVHFMKTRKEEVCNVVYFGYSIVRGKEQKK